MATNLATVTSRARFRILAAFLLCIVLLSSCEIAVDIGIDVEDDGSGNVAVNVRADEDAVADGPSNLEDMLRLQDLEDAGWVITGPEEDQGEISVRAEKGFSRPDQLQGVLDEITGVNGMFSNFELTSESEFAQSEFAIVGDIDLGQREDLFNDDEITELLDGNPLGKPLADYLPDGQTLDDVVPITVSVRLPGEGAENSRSEATFSPQFADAAPTRVQLSTVNDIFIARVLRWVGFALAGLCALSAVLALLGFFLDRRAMRRPQTPPSVATRVPARPGMAPYQAPVAAPQPVPGHYSAVPPLQARPAAPSPQRSQAAPQHAGGTHPQAAVSAGSPGSQLRHVIVDPLGVLYRLPSSPEDMMLTFVREQGSDIDAGEVVDNYLEVTFGRMTTAEFWEAVEVEGDVDELNTEWIGRFRPRSGAADFLREMRRRQLPVSVLSNDGEEWSTMLQQRDNLGVVSPWIASGAIGARKPDPGLYDALRRELKSSYERCLFIDTVVDDLDAGRTLGMQTAFMPSGREVPDRPNHPVVKDFSDFFKRR